MGIADSFEMAYAKAQFAAGSHLPESGCVFISVNRRDTDAILPTAKLLLDMGFNIIATPGTADALSAANLKVETIKKVQHGSPNVIEIMDEGKLAMIYMTPSIKGRSTEGDIRQKALIYDIPLYTTISGAEASAKAIQALKNQEPGVLALQAQ
jgi:carbamoyl-phosphate synthase large subunit